MSGISVRTLTLLALVAIPFVAFPVLKLTRSRTRRLKRIPPSTERVLILGASSGVGRVLAHLCAKRGARVCIVGRRKDAVENVRSECLTFIGLASSDEHVLAIAADFTDAESMVELRSTIESGE